MRKMGIDPEMMLTEAVELYPQSLKMFMSLGMCCINPENEGWTVRTLCANYGVHADSFCDAVNESI